MQDDYKRASIEINSITVLLFLLVNFWQENSTQQ